jgi:hypothetical protein
MKSYFKNYNVRYAYEQKELPNGKFDRIVIPQIDIIYFSELVNEKIVAPAGFRSDGASVPRIFWNLFPPFHRYLLAAIVHDHLCVQGKSKTSKYSSKQVHKIFHEAMKVLKVPRRTRWPMYTAVKFFGPKWK